jgi:hypothetical protein
MNAVDIAIGTKVETTHHLSGHHQWFPAEVVKVTAHCVDIKTARGSVVRYRKDTCREQSSYCGFRSTFRIVTAAA